MKPDSQSLVQFVNGGGFNFASSSTQDHKNRQISSTSSSTPVNKPQQSAPQPVSAKKVQQSAQQLINTVSVPKQSPQQSMLVTKPQQSAAQQQSINVAPPVSIPKQSANNVVQPVSKPNNLLGRPGSKSIFVRNLPSKVTESDVAQLIEKFGVVKKDGIRILEKYKNCGAFVEFESEQGAKDAIMASVIELASGRRIYIEPQRNPPRNDNRQSAQQPINKPHQSDPVNVDGPVNKPPQQSTQQSNHVTRSFKKPQQSAQQPKSNKIDNNQLGRPSAKTICVSNLPSNWETRDVYNVFKQFGYIKKDGIRMKDSIAFVEFEYHQGAKDAVKASSIHLADESKIYIRPKDPSAIVVEPQQAKRSNLKEEAKRGNLKKEDKQAI